MGVRRGSSVTRGARTLTGHACPGAMSRGEIPGGLLASLPGGHDPLAQVRRRFSPEVLGQTGVQYRIVVVVIHGPGAHFIFPSTQSRNRFLARCIKFFAPCSVMESASAISARDRLSRNRIRKAICPRSGNCSKHSRSASSAASPSS